MTKQLLKPVVLLVALIAGVTTSLADSFNPVSASPADGSALELQGSGWASEVFSLTFASAPTVVDITNVKLTSSVSGEVAPDDAWTSRVSGNTVTFWGADYDGYTMTFKADSDATYTLNIPAGTFKDAAGNLNDEINLTYYGPKKTTPEPQPSEPFAPVSTNPADNSVIATNSTGWANLSFDITFAEDITIENSTPNATLHYGTKDGPIAYSLDARAVKGSDSKTLNIWSDDGDGMVDMFKPKNDSTYVLVIPAGVVKNAAGVENDEITLTFLGPKTAKPISYVSSDPENNSIITLSNSGYADMAVTLTFSEPVTPKVSSPAASLHKDGVNGTEIEAEDEWKATQGDNANSVKIWAADYDGFLQSFKPDSGSVYVFVIPAGTIQNAAGDVNDEIVISVKTPEKKKISMVSSTPEYGGVIDDKASGNYQYMRAYINLDEDFTVVNFSANVHLYEGGIGGKEITPYGEFWHTTHQKTAQLYVWGDDYDGGVDYFTPKDTTYYLVVPAGTIKGKTTGTLNDDIVLMFYGTEKAKENAEQTDGINSVSREAESVPVARYNLRGQRISGAQKGVNILKFADGTAKKVVVK